MRKRQAGRPPHGFGTHASGDSSMLRAPRIGLATAVLGCIFAAPTSRGDEFDRIEGEALAALPKSKDAKGHPSLTMGEIDALPRVLRDSRSAFLVARTGPGNLARLLVSPALRKTPGGPGAPV